MSAGAHALRVERQNLVVHLRQARLALAHKLRLEGASPVAWGINLDLAVLSPQTLGAGAIAAVARATTGRIMLVVAEVLVELIFSTLKQSEGALWFWNSSRITGPIYD